MYLYKEYYPLVLTFTRAWRAIEGLKVRTWNTQSWCMWDDTGIRIEEDFNQKEESQLRAYCNVVAEENK